MSGYIGTKSVTLSTTSANVGGDSTVGGDLTVDTNTLYVDSTNNRVGVGTTPATALDVLSGSASVGALKVKNASGASASTPILEAINGGGNTRLIVLNDGSVGIGTTPSTVLHINDASDPILRLQRGGAAYSQFQSDSAGSLYISADAGNSGASSRMQFNVDGSERCRLDSSGRFLINTTATANYGQTSGDGNWIFRTEQNSVIHAQNADSAFSMMYMNKFNWTSSKDSRYINWYKNGSSVATIALTSGGLISYGTGSDYRLKENVTDMTGGIPRIKQISPKQFNLIDDPNNITMDGFLAHEIATVIPEAVVGTHNQVKSRTNVVRNADGNFIEDGVTQAEWTQGKTDGVYPSDSTWDASWDEPIYQTVDYGKVTPLLTAALKEAITKIETLETEMTSVKARLDALEGN